MGHGHWHGDRAGGRTYEGDIADLSVNAAEGIEFDYSYRHGASGAGHFKGDITGDPLIGSWDEICDGKSRVGIVNMKRTKPVSLEHRFKGSYLLKSAAPLKKDDQGDWTIEFDV